MLAAIFLGNEYVLFPSFYSSMNLPFLVGEGTKILDGVLEKFPNSVMFLWMAGRFERLKGNIVKSNILFQKAYDSQNYMMQLQHVNDYEIGWNNMILRDWKAAIPHFDRLLKENSWSKCFYAYAKAICMIEAGDVEEGHKLVLLAPTYVERTFGGKVISVEQFAIARAKVLKEKGALILPGIEMCYLWNLFQTMSDKLLVEVLADVEQALKKARDSKDTSTQALMLLYKGAANRILKNGVEAEKNLLDARTVAKSAKSNTFVAPFASYELGVLYASRAPGATNGDPYRYLKKAKAYSHDYFFKMLLHFRIHLLQLELKNIGDKIGLVEKDDEKGEEKEEEEDKIVGDL